MDLMLFFLLAGFWGGSFIAIKLVVTGVGPLTASTARVLVALVTLGFLLSVMRRSVRVPRRALPLMWIGGMFSTGLPFALLFWGERVVSPGLGGLINGTVPIWTFLFGQMLPRRESFSRKTLLGILAGMAGVLVIFVPKLVLPGTDLERLAALAVLGMSLSYGVGTHLTRAALTRYPGVDGAAVVVQQLCAGLVFLGTLALVIEGPQAWAAFADGPPALTVSALYLGCCSTALAFLIFFRLIRNWGSVRAASVTYLIPPVAVFLDFLVNGAVPASTDVVGGGMILGGVLLLRR